MPNENLVTRREFTLDAALAMLAGVTITITGCGGGDDNNSTSGGGSPTGPSGQPGDEIGSISLNHGHTAVISSAQLTAGAALALDIRGTADHPHTVSLNAGELMQISAGTRVTKQSTTDALHSHSVTFN